MNKEKNKSKSKTHWFCFMKIPENKLAIVKE